MYYSEQDVFDFIEEEDVKFIRLTFCDITGRLKNISIMPHELRRAFEHGISFDASAIKGFGDEVESDLFLFPIPSTMFVIPWRPARGKVVRMFCHIRRPDGSAFPMDSRLILEQAIQKARDAGITVRFGSEFEFYLFRLNENGDPTDIPFDRAGYMDISPEDRGENLRREICLMLEDMGIVPESSHHEEGPGQNEIDFRYSNALTAADQVMQFLTVVKSVAVSNGVYADFSPKPIPNEAGNGMHINLSVQTEDGSNVMPHFIAGILAHIREMTYFLNPSEESYHRLGEKKAPKYVTWSHQNRSQLIRIPAAQGEYKRMELRSPDPTANTYIAYALLIHAGLDGIRQKMELPEAMNINLYTAGDSITSRLDKLPENLYEARQIAQHSAFLKAVLPQEMIP